MTSKAYRDNYNLIQWLPIKPSAPPKERERRAFYIVSDIQPYRSPVTGEVISGRARERDHLRQHGLEQMGNEKPKPPRRPQVTKDDVMKDAHAAFEMVKQGYRPPPIGTYKDE